MSSEPTSISYRPGAGGDRKLERGEDVHSYITKYEENGKRYAESWLQVNAFGRSLCFNKKKIEI